MSRLSGTGREGGVAVPEGTIQEDRTIYRYYTGSTYSPYPPPTNHSPDVSICKGGVRPTSRGPARRPSCIVITMVPPCPT
jgi:hypothetical protein